MRVQPARLGTEKTESKIEPRYVGYNPALGTEKD